MARFFHPILPITDPMARLLTDEELAALFKEPKPLPANWQTRLAPRHRDGDRHLRRNYEVPGDGERSFRIRVRLAIDNKLDFSILLVLVEGKDEYTLTRFNGKHASAHTNRWEKDQGQPTAAIRNEFHIHVATERYQSGSRYDIVGYAEPTDRYHDFDSALEAFCSSNGFVVPTQEPAQPLLEGLDDDE